MVERARRLAADRIDARCRSGSPPTHCATFASLLLAYDPDVVNAMTQLGHTDPSFTMAVYSHLMRRSGDEREQLRALIEGREWAETGRKSDGQTVEEFVAETGGRADTASASHDGERARQDSNLRPPAPEARTSLTTKRTTPPHDD